MLVRFIPLATVSLMTLSGLPASLSGPADAPRDDAPPAAAADLKPVTVAVVDRESAVDVLLTRPGGAVRANRVTPTIIAGQ